jgi:hypothetical protein
MKPSFINLIPLFKLTSNKNNELEEVCNNSIFKSIFNFEMNKSSINTIFFKQYQEYISNSKLLIKNINLVIFKNKTIIGYCDLNNNSLSNIPRTSKTYPYCLRFYLTDEYKKSFPEFYEKLKEYLKKINISPFDIWTFVLETEHELVPILINNKFLYGKKLNNLQTYILDFRIKNLIIKKTIKQKQDIFENLEIVKFNSGKLRGYENCFIMSVRTKEIYINTNILRNHLLNCNLLEAKSPQRKPVFMFLEVLESHRPDSRYYDTECYIMNILSKSKFVITNKYWLYLNFQKQYPIQCSKYMAKTVELSEFNKDLLLDKENVFIVRPVGIGAWSGHDIVVMTGKEPSSIKLAYNLVGKYENVIASEYITKPLLWEGKKMHLRSFLLASVIDGIYATYFFDFYRIYHAKLPFVNADYNNKDIHDTHLKSTSRNIFGPFDIEDEKLRNIFINIINPKIEDCMKYISKLLEEHAKPYNNSKNAFEIFGVDIMIRQDSYDIVVIEINEHTGLELKKEPQKIEEFSLKYFNNIDDMIINPAIRCIEPKSKPIYKTKLN